MQRQRSRRDIHFYEAVFLGAAIGDALGAPIEFWSIAKIREVHGPTGLTDYAEAYGRRGAITDDTQMAMFTAEGILAAGSQPVIPFVREAYRTWYRGQRGEAERALAGLSLIEAFRERRAPGTTCLDACSRGANGTVADPINESKGAGGLIRVFPIGLASDRPFLDGVEAAALTHGHPSGYLAAGVLAELLWRIADGQELAEALASARGPLGGWPGHEEVLERLEWADRLAKCPGAPTPAWIAELGAGWVAEEALAIGVHCALKARSFQDGVLLAVNHSGDSDTTGAVAGALLGALHGRWAIPERWVKQLEGVEAIEKMAFQFFLRDREAGRCR